MSEPGQFTAQQAQDPATPPEVLAEIAAQRPDLRPYLAANPQTYPALLEWLSQLGDPAVDAALRARPIPGAPPGAFAPPGGAAPWPAGPSDAPASAAAPHGQPGYGQPGYGPPGYGPPGHGQPGYGPPPGGPARAKSKTWVWVLVAVLALVVVGGVVAGIVAFRSINRAIEDGLLDPTGETQTYGDDQTLDALWDDCAAGDMEACDDLYLASPLFSDYEAFGDTCGERSAESHEGTCAEEAPTGPTGSDLEYGDDEALDALWDACEAGDMTSCDELYLEAPLGSEYRAFGDTCGGRSSGGAWCRE